MSHQKFKVCCLGSKQTCNRNASSWNPAGSVDGQHNPWIDISPQLRVLSFIAGGNPFELLTVDTVVAQLGIWEWRNKMHPSPAHHSGWLSSGGPSWFSQWESPVPRPVTSSPSSGSASSAAWSTPSPSTTLTRSCPRGRHVKASTTRSQAFPSLQSPPAMPGARGEKLVFGRNDLNWLGFAL